MQENKQKDDKVTNKWNICGNEWKGSAKWMREDKIDDIRKTSQVICQ